MAITRLTDRTIIAEYASGGLYILMTMMMLGDMMFNNAYHPYSMIIVFGAFGFLQCASVAFRKDMILLRVCMTWVSASIWTWLTFTNYEHLLSMGVLVVGITNMYAFVYLVNRVSIDWNRYFKEE